MPLSRLMLLFALAGALSATVIGAERIAPGNDCSSSGKKRVRHEAVTHAMVTIERLGRETGLWDTVIRTDTEALTKTKLEYNAKTLNDFERCYSIPAARSKWTIRRRPTSSPSYMTRERVHRHPQRGDHVHPVAGLRRNDRRLLRRASLEHVRRADCRRGPGVSRNAVVEAVVHADRRDLPDQDVLPRRTLAC